MDAATLQAQGAVSAAVAEQMARGARERAGVEVGVGITGIAGPDGGSDEQARRAGVRRRAVSPLGEFVRMLRLQGSRATVRERAAQTALDLLRRHLLGLPVDADAGLSARDRHAWTRDRGGRLFLAVFPPPAVRAEARGRMDALRTRGDRVAWVKRENLHYTLRFLGEQDDDAARVAGEAASEAAAAHGRSTPRSTRPARFPHAARARVLWLGIREGESALRALARSLDPALVARGFDAADRPFAPHLTIGRLREPDDWTATARRRSGR